MTYNTGSPIGLSSGISTISTAGAYPNIVGALPKSSGTITKVAAINGVAQFPNYFNGYTTALDTASFAAVSPACAPVAPATTTTACNSLFTSYTNRALLDPNGNVIAVNPNPGQVGSLGPNTLRGPGFFDLDMNMVKRFKITETKNFEFRVDAINILNHPNFSGPNTSINSIGTFGQITSLAAGLNTGGNGGMRSFLVNTRINF